MAITIDNVEYDETTLDDAVRNSIVQVQSSTNTISKLKAEILNHQILIAHHSKNIKEIYQLMMMQKRLLKPLM